MKANRTLSYLLANRHDRQKVFGLQRLRPLRGSRSSPSPTTHTHRYSKSLLPTNIRRRLRQEESRSIYGVGDVSAGDSAVAAGDSNVAAGDSAVVVVAGAVASVVAGGLVAAGVAAGSVVSVFCSHAARSAALARMQMYFFIVLIGRAILL